MVFRDLPSSSSIIPGKPCSCIQPLLSHSADHRGGGGIYCCGNDYYPESTRVKTKQEHNRNKKNTHKHIWVFSNIVQACESWVLNFFFFGSTESNVIHNLKWTGDDHGAAKAARIFTLNTLLSMVKNRERRRFLQMVHVCAFFNNTIILMRS